MKINETVKTGHQEKFGVIFNSVKVQVDENNNAEFKFYFGRKLVMIYGEVTLLKSVTTAQEALNEIEKDEYSNIGYSETF